MGELIKKSKQFVAETVSELKKCNWPNKNELTEQTILVIVAVIILAFFVAGVDEINMKLINWLTIK